MKGFQTSDWAYILCGWLFSRPSFHEHVFEAKVESIVRPLEVFRGHFETKVTFDIMMSFAYHIWKPLESEAALRLLEAAHNYYKLCLRIF